MNFDVSTTCQFLCLHEMTSTFRLKGKKIIIKSLAKMTHVHCKAFYLVLLIKILAVSILLIPDIIRMVCNFLLSSWHWTLTANIRFGQNNSYYYHYYLLILLHWEIHTYMHTYMYIYVRILRADKYFPCAIVTGFALG